MGDKKIRGGALVARALRDKGIDNVFTLSGGFCNPALEGFMAVSYTHLRAHETTLHLVCRLLLEKKKRH